MPTGSTRAPRPKAVPAPTPVTPSSEPSATGPVVSVTPQPFSSNPAVHSGTAGEAWTVDKDTPGVVSWVSTGGDEPRRRPAAPVRSPSGHRLASTMTQETTP